MRRATARQAIGSTIRSVRMRRIRNARPHDYLAPVRPSLLAALLGLAVAVGAEVGVTDGPKGVVVNTRNGKAYAAFPDLGVVKIVSGADRRRWSTLKTGANVKDLTIDPRSGRVYAMNRGPGTISVIDPDTDAIVDTLEGRSRQPDGAQSGHQQAVRVGQHRHRSVGDRSGDEAIDDDSRRHRGQRAVGRTSRRTRSTSSATRTTS